MDDPQARRLTALEAFLSRKGIDALLITSPPNLRYFTGFTGGEGVFLASPPEWTLFVDARYTLRAQTECPGISVSEARRPVETAAERLKERRCRRVGLETAHLTVDLFRRIKRSLPHMGIRSLRDALDGLRMIKDPVEIEKIQGAIAIHTRALDETLAWLTPEVTERDWAVEFAYRARRLGAEALAFDTIVASGPRSAIPHATADPIPLTPSSPVIFDHGVVLDGYCSDETVTFFTTPPSRSLRELYQVVKEAHDLAIEAVHPGQRSSAIDAVARDHIDKAGYGRQFSHGTGHGVGLEIHERPTVAPRDRTVLAPGMVFTIEPGIYLNGIGGVRIEDTVLVTSKGCHVLTKRPKSLTVLFE